MASPFRPIDVLLVQYARYHRDPRNIAIHGIGIPLIVFAIAVLLSRPSFTLFGLSLSPIWFIWLATVFWYLTRGSLALGLAVSLLTGALVWLAQLPAAGGTAQWLGWGIGTFVVGWILQAIGHVWEGRKPAFVDDLTGLLVGPMFVTAEALFVLGWGAPLLAEIERGAGPVTRRLPSS